MRVVLASLTGLLVAGVVVLGGASAAHACSCVPRTPAEVLQGSAAVFTGEFTSPGPVFEALEPHEPSSTALRFRVEEVFVGDVGPEAEVLTTNSSCGLSAQEGERWFVVAVREPPGDELYASNCGGSEVVGLLRRRATP